jgi:hypothetical protein
MAQTDSSSSYWLRLLQYQRARGRTGLTVPFLIGASWESTRTDAIDEDTAFCELSSLLLALRDARPTLHSVVIAECGDLHQPIAALYPQGQARSDCEGLPDQSGAATRLYVQRSYFQGRKCHFDSAVGFLWNRLGGTLTRAEFSFREGRYAPFDPEDRLFIERALAHGQLTGCGKQGFLC